MAVAGLFVSYSDLSSGWKDRGAIIARGQNGAFLLSVNGSILRGVIAFGLCAIVLLEGLQPHLFNQRTMLVTMLGGVILLSIVNILTRRFVVDALRMGEPHDHE